MPEEEQKESENIIREESAASPQEEEEASARRSAAGRADLLHGPLLPRIILFAIPLAATSILQQLFNAADTAVVGRFASSRSMAAVGANGSLISLFISLFSGLAVGTNVVAAHMIGEGRQENITKAVHTSVTLALLSGVLLIFVGQIFAHPFLAAMGTPEDCMELAVLYLRIYFLGMPFIMLYNFNSALLRSEGDSRRPLIALILSGIVNVFLNLLLVIVFRLDVAGVAIATVISNVISSGLTTLFLVREKGSFHLDLRKLGIDRRILIQIMRIGIPAGLQGMVFSIANVLIQSGINSFGADCVAGNTAASNFETICYFVVNAFAQTAVTFTSQNYGAGKTDRCDAVLRQCMAAGLSTTLALSLVIWIFRGSLIQIFTTDPAVIRFAMTRLLLVCLLELLTGTYEIPGGCMRGMGYSLTPTLITVLGSCALRLVWLATVFRAFHTLDVLLIVYPISWVVTGTATILAFFRVRRHAYAALGRKTS